MPWKCLTCDTLHADSADSCRTCKKLVPSVQYFESDTKLVSYGSSIYLEWSVINATNVWIDSERVEGTGKWKLSPKKTTIYTLKARNEVKEISAKVRVELPQPVIKYFTVAEAEIRLGLPTILYWEVENAEKILIDREVGEVSGQTFLEAYFDRSGPVSLTAINQSGKVSKTLELFLPKPSIQEFAAQSMAIKLRNPSILYWETTNAAQITLEPEIGDVSGYSRAEVFPDRSTTFTLMATNNSGVVYADLELVLHPPKINFFRADNELSTEGRSVVLYWEVENAYMLMIDNEVGDVSERSEIRVKPREAITIYKLTAIGHSGRAETEVQVNIFPIPMKETMLVEAPEINDDFLLDKNELNRSLQEPEPEIISNIPADLEKQIRIELKAQAKQKKKLDIDHYKNLELTDDMMHLEKASLRKEVSRIYNLIKKRISSKTK